MDLLCLRKSSYALCHLVQFLDDGEDEAAKQEKTAAEIIRNKFKRLTISDETKELVQGLSLSSEEMNDERTKHILGYRQ